MKTDRNEAKKLDHPVTDEQRLDELDELVANAARGDRFAIALSPRLLAEAREALGELFAQDDGDVLQDFFTALCEGKLSFPPIRGAGVPWMMRMIREKAWGHLARRGPYGGEAG
jgi:hypothetical protein